MGISPRNSVITGEFECQFKVHLKDGSLGAILSALCKLMPQILTDFIQKVLIGFGEYIMSLKREPFSCEQCGNDEKFILKTRHGKDTKILTVFQWVTLSHSIGGFRDMCDTSVGRV